MKIIENCKRNKSRRWVITLLNYQFVYLKLYYSKTLKEAKRIYQTLTDMRYNGEIVFTAINLYDRKKCKILMED